MWKQRSKYHWLKEGDSNTKYFHRIANFYRHKNYIPLIKDGNNIHHSKTDILNIFTRYYHSLLGEINTSSNKVQANWDILYPNPNHLLLASLEQPFTKEEIKKAIFSLGIDKAPSSDGFNALFFQYFQHLVRNDLLDLFHSFYNNNLDMLRFNLAHITLIPKKEGACELNNFRPISLLNTPYKITTKTLSNRLSIIIDQLVDPVQTTLKKKNFR